MNKKVLVVDDDISIRELLEQILKHLGYNVFFAASWGEALILLDSIVFDILITDYRMPQEMNIKGITNGIELIRFIKLYQPELGMRMILMSDVMDGSISSVALAAGADMAVDKRDICDIEKTEGILKNLEGGD